MEYAFGASSGIQVMRVIVIGAGIMGMTTAWHLATRGHEVVVIDKEDGAAKGSSFANGAQLSYGYAEPMASPTTLQHIPAWLISPNAPLKFHWRLDYAMWRWCFQMLRECSASRYVVNRRRLFDLATHSKTVMDTFLSENDLDFNYKKCGKLHLYSDARAMEKAAIAAEEEIIWGYPQQIWDAKTCLAQEPALASYKGNIAGGIFSSEDAVGDPHRFSEALITLMKQKKYPVSYQFKTECQSLIKESGTIKGVEISNGIVQGDAYVMAGGASSASLLRPLGLKIPIYPVKGYSITLSAKGNTPFLRMSITDRQRKIVFAPLGNHLRVAGIAELAGYDLSCPDKRIEVLKAAVEEVFPDSYAMDNVHPWAGFRPMTPNGLPLLCKCYYNNLYLNTGQGMLGWTLSQGCASLLADAIERKPMPAFWDTLS